jgi:dTDP-4-amino-4,6-dideoxygalactose transaminase
MSKVRIPILDLAPEVHSLWEPLNKAIQGVLRSTQFINGPDVVSLEKECAGFLGVARTIGLNSGTDALTIGLRALGVGSGDEVITSSFSFFATAEAILTVGATPVFVDIDPLTFNIDTRLIEAKVTPKTKAIIPVHLYGQAADMDPIMALAKRHGLFVLEDVAQAFGAEYRGKKTGTIGHLGAYSFFPSKTLGAYGDAGLVGTNDQTLADGVAMLRAHGAKKKYHNEVLGYNSRLDTIQAAILRVKLPHLDQWNNARNNAAHRYSELLQGIPGISTPVAVAGCRHVFHQYTIRVAGGRRDALQKDLEGHGIQTMVYYPIPIHKLPLFRDLKLALPEAERASAEVISLPMWPQIEVATQQRVVEAIRTFMTRY